MSSLLKHVALWALVFLTGCATLGPADLKMLRTARDVNLGHVNDETLPTTARQIAQDNYDVDCQLMRAATGEAIPEDVRARLGLTKEEE